MTSTEKGFSPTCNDIDILLPTTIKEFIQFNYGKFSIAITPSGDNSAEGKPDGKSVSYTGVFGENTILRYTPMLSGLKEDIIVTDKAAPTEYSFVLKTNGLSIRSDEDGFYLSLTENSEEKIRLGNVVAYDSNGRESIGELFVNTVSEGSEYVVTIYVDSKFLIDESTVFPVTIDPTFTVSDNTHGSNAIQDAPIFQGYPNGNFGNYIYNSVGTPDSNFGIGRTVVKLNGFTSATEYTTITASQIDSVLFYAKEASGSSTQTINLHPITDVSSWTENTVTWNTIGNSFNTSIDFGTTMYNGQWSSFDITNLVKGWKSGSYVADCGFILKNSSEANYKNFHSCECTTTGNRPYVVLTYTPTISLNYSSFDIDEGATRTITATTHPSGLTVSWHTSDSTAATVSGGIVTGVAAKTTAVTISASVTVDGTTYTTTCQVYVTISDGVYYLKNQNSNYYLHVKDGNINNYTDVVQFPLYGSSYINAYRIRQLWKIKYIGSGKYSVRPMHKLNMGLDVDDGNVDIYTIGTTDSLSGIINDARWSIGRYSNSSSGLIFQNNGTASKTMQVSGASNTIEASVIAGNYSSISLNCRWMPTLVSSPPTGVIIYDTSTGLYVNPAIRYVAPGETRSLYSFNLTAAFYSGTAITQTVTWSSSDTSVATVNSSTGNVTGVSPGWTVIYASRLVGGTTYSASYDVYVTEIANATYCLKNKQNSDYVRVKNGTMNNNQNAVQYDFDGSDYEKWIFKLNTITGYYSIKSVGSSNSSYYLAVKDDSSALDCQIVIRNATESTLTDGMKWKVEKTTSGAYKIIPKTGEANDYVLATGTSFGTNNVNLVQGDFIQNGSYRDEWFFEVRLNTTLEGQKWSNWCWVASARMFSNHYYNITRTQNQAVQFVKGVVVNEGGWENESQNAIGYYISNISGASLNMQNVISNGSSNCRRYPENVLRHFLDDGHAVFITRSWYDGTTRTGGHSILIIGYVTKTVNNEVQYRYIIYNPWPASEPDPWDSPTVTSGQSYLRSYQWICNGLNALPDDGGTDHGIWEGYVTVVTSYSNDSVLPIWNE